MNKRIIAVSICSLLLLLAAIAAGLNAIFSVTSVKVNFSVFSEEARKEAKSLQEELDSFVGASTTFLNLDDVKQTVAKYPSFRLESAEKDFPQTVVLSVTERRETFALKREDGKYDIYDSEGAYLGVKEKNVNRADGAENILLEGFSLTAETGKIAQGDRFAELLLAVSAFEAQTGSARMNIKSVAFVRPLETDVRTESFELQTREGVTVILHNPSVKAGEKAEKAAQKYIGLEDEDRMFGKIRVLDVSATGEILEPTYEPRVPAENN